MAEDNKPKIDLKSRLGKKTVSSPNAGGGSIPPPVGIPKPVGMSRPGGSIPAPPFGSAPAAAPRVDPTNPYGAMEPQAAPVRAAPAAITIELSPDVVAAQKRGRGKVLVLCIITAGIGGFLGFAAGGGVERGKGTDAAIAGAKELSTKVQESVAKGNELADVLKAATQKLGQAKFPDEEVSKLGAINIPFTPADLNGKGIGRFNREALSMLIDFSTAVDKVNDQKERLQNVLSGNKKGVTDFLDSLNKPQVRWSVVLGNGPGGPWATMQPIPTPFAVKDDSAKWPADIKVPGADGKNAVLKRYTSGNPVSEDGLFVPVDPGSQAAVCSSDVLVKLKRELGDLEATLRGDNTPGDEKTGLLEAGTKLMAKLKQIGATPPGG